MLVMLSFTHNKQIVKKKKNVIQKKYNTRLDKLFSFKMAIQLKIKSYKTKFY